MDWATRCHCESKLYEQNAFITLTYADEPPDGEAAVHDWKNFAKALRRRIGKFRYFACTERGELHGRLHHHALIFGHDFLEPLKQRWLEDAWSSQKGAGFIDVAACEPASINYVAGYTAKKLSEGVRDDLRMRASLSPPIGYDWLRLYHDDVERAGGVVIEGKLYPIPALFVERNKHGFRHVRADARAYAASHTRSELALRARELRMKVKRREKMQVTKL